MYKKRKLIYLLLALVFTFNFTNMSLADTVENLNKKHKNASQQMKEKQNEIKAIEKESKDVSRQIIDLDIKLDKATTELTGVEKELKNLGIKIDKTTAELNEAEENLGEKQETFNSRLRVMYKTGDVGYLEILLSSADIKDFLSRKDMVKTIADHDIKLMKYMKEQRDIIDTKKVELQTQMKEVEVSKVKLETRRRDLAKATREKEDLMGRLQEDIKSAEKEYDKLNDYAKQIESDIRKLAKSTNPYSGGTMAWPVPGYSRISSPYGYRIHPIFKTKKLHTGIDIPAPTGTNVTAGSDGTVIYTGTLGGYGKTVMIDHGGGIVTLYAHNSSIPVSEGQSIKKGQTIAKAGSTGYSTGPHSHFEVRKNGSYVDPLPWVKGK